MSLNITRLSRERYDELIEYDLTTLYIVKDKDVRGSIYFDGVCYGEDYDEDIIFKTISILEKKVPVIEPMTNFEIEEILNS